MAYRYLGTIESLFRLQLGAPNDKYSMPGEKPFYIVGEVKQISNVENIAYVRVPNGNVYYVYGYTPGIDFARLKIGTMVNMEVTTMLTRVLSASIIQNSDAGECDGSTLGS